MSIVVSDTSPIRAFDHLGRIDLLASLFGELLVPPAVVRELEIPTSKLPPLTVTRLLPPFRMQAPGNRATVERYRRDLDPGESEALALALELDAVVLIDETRGRAVAERDRIRMIGTAGILLLSKEQKLIAAVQPLMVRLRDETSFRISPAFFADVLRLANESPNPSP